MKALILACLMALSLNLVSSHAMAWGEQYNYSYAPYDDYYNYYAQQMAQQYYDYYNYIYQEPVPVPAQPAPVVCQWEAGMCSMAMWCSLDEYGNTYNCQSGGCSPDTYVCY